ncbi:hypothetical protein QEW_4287 [Clostridioides difficile CD160]|nr:hypothetical protein QEW_4287 [Clostridioides difficile CD160]
MNEKPCFRQTVAINTVKNIPIALIVSVVVLIIPLYLSYFVASIIISPIAIKLIGMRQTRKFTNYNIENG